MGGLQVPVWDMTVTGETVPRTKTPQVRSGRVTVNYVPLKNRPTRRDDSRMKSERTMTVR